MDKFVLVLVTAFCCTNAFRLDANSVDRISNGIIAADNQFPYAVSLQQLSLLQNTTRGHRCGGVLITLQHVLITASCMYDLVNDSVVVPIQANQFRVFAGASLLTNDAVPDRIRSIANFTIHPEHVPAPALVNDIAIITLLTPFLNTTVIPTPIPAANFAPADFSLCTVAGWGATTINANTSVELRYTTKYVYNQALCSSIYSTAVGVSNVFPSMLCAASYDILSVGCQGDAGNALVCNNQLTGILFFPTNCQATSFPELYTRVANYTTWIRSVTGGASSFKPELTLLGLFTILQMVFIKIIN